MKKCTCGNELVLVNDFGKDDGEYSILPSVYVGCVYCDVYTKRFTYLLDRDNAEYKAISAWNRHVT